MKVLYLSVFRDASGWAYHAQQNMLAMDSVGIEVVPRCVKLNNNQGEVHPRILEMEKRSDRNCDVVVQHLLPHLYEYHGGFKKNIGVYCTETSSFNGICWGDRINLMDECWVPCDQMVEAGRNSGVNIPLHPIGIPSDLSCFSKEYEKFDIPNHNDDFKFYFIGDSTTQRKNLEALIKAFHIEFHLEEPVCLIIKSGGYGKSRDEMDKELEGFCTNIKSGLKLYPGVSSYKKELLINEQMSFEGIKQLHATCDCFVMPSYGESWCMPAYDAMGFGNQVIYNDVGGMSEMMGDYGMVVKNRKEPCYGAQAGVFPEMFLADEDWWSIDVRDLQRNMRAAYEDEKKGGSFSREGLSRASSFGYDHIGKKMKELL